MRAHLLSIDRRACATFSALALCAALTGCHLDMWNGGRLKPFEESGFPAFDGMSSRMLVEGTVPYGASVDTHLSEGKVNGELVDEFPEGIELSRELLELGRTRYDIYCLPCHGISGHHKIVVNS